jgi:hypothetical protein
MTKITCLALAGLLTAGAAGCAGLNPLAPAPADAPQSASTAPFPVIGQEPPAPTGQALTPAEIAARERALAAAGARARAEGGQITGAR